MLLPLLTPYIFVCICVHVCSIMFVSITLFCVLYYVKLFINRFGIVGYGCMTCIGNSGPLPEPVVDAIEQVTL